MNKSGSESSVIATEFGEILRQLSCTHNHPLHDQPGRDVTEHGQCALVLNVLRIAVLSDQIIPLDQQFLLLLLYGLEIGK